MRRVTVGIDASSKKIAAVVTVDGHDDPLALIPPTLWKRTLVGDDIVVRCSAAYRWGRWMMSDVDKMLAENGIYEYEVQVYIEEPVVVPRNMRSTVVQAKVHGAIVAGIRSSRRYSQVPITSVVPPSWKKQVVGKGNATKPEVSKHVFIVWPYVYNLASGDQDLLDAACINLFGQKARKTQPAAS